MAGQCLKLKKNGYLFIKKATRKMGQSGLPVLVFVGQNWQEVVIRFCILVRLAVNFMRSGKFANNSDCINIVAFS